MTNALPLVARPRRCVEVNRFPFARPSATLPNVGKSARSTHSQQSLTANESLLWHAETLRGQSHPWFGALAVLAHEPDPASFEEALTKAGERVPRLRERVVTRGLGFGLPTWSRADMVDTRYHVRRLRLRQDADLTSALAALAVIAALPMDRGRPLWECYLLGPLNGGRSLCFFKFHGALIDSVEVTEVLAACGSDPAGRRGARGLNGEQGRGVWQVGMTLARDGFRRTWRATRDTARASLGAIRHPVASLESAWRGARALPDVVSDAVDTVAKELDGVDVSRPVRNFDVFSIPTALLERTARPLAVAPDDLLLGVLTAALRAVRPPVARRVVDAVCMARLQRASADDGAGRVVLGSLPLPVGERRDSRRLALVREARKELSEDISRGVSPWLAHAVGILPRVPGSWVAGMGIGNAAASFFDCGKVEEWGSLAGADIEACYGFSDLVDSASLGATVLRAGPLIHVGIIGDARLPTDSRSFHGLFDTALRQMEALAERFARGGRRYAEGVAADVDW